MFQLKPQDPLGKKLFPAFVDRCIEFIDVHNSDSDPIWMGSLLYNNFYQQTNYIHCLVAVDDKQKLKAHSFSFVENTHKLGLHIHILQIWKSEGGPEIIEKGLELIEEWMRELKLKTVTYNADDLAKLRLYERFGFKLYRVVGKKELADG